MPVQARRATQVLAPTTDSLIVGNNGPSGTGSTSDATSDTTGQVATSGTDAHTSFLTTNTSTEGDTEDLPPSDPVCIAYAMHLVECIPRFEGYEESLAQECTQFKSDGLRVDGQACVNALEAVFLCLTKIDCAELVGESTPCDVEAMAAESACPDLIIDSDTTGGSSG